MTNFLKTIVLALTLLSTNLNAQLSIPDAAVLGKMLNESVAVFQVADSDAYAETCAIVPVQESSPMLTQVSGQ